MRCSLRDCLICRRSPSSLTYGKNWSQDATNQTRNSSRHRICILWCGTPCVLIEVFSIEPIGYLYRRAIEFG